MFTTLLGGLRRLFPSKPPFGDALVTLFLRQQRLLIQTSDLTVTGLWVMRVGPVISLESSVSSAALGQVVLGALADSRAGVLHPAREEDREVWLRMAIKVRSRRAWMQGSRGCGVRREHGRICLVPLHTGGSRGPGRGFHDITEAPLELPPDVSAEGLGKALLEALSRTTVAEEARPR